MPYAKGKVAFVTGANGISGHAIVEHLVKLPASDWSQIIVTSRRPLPVAWVDPRVSFVAADFLEPVETNVQKLSSICKDVTHAFYTSYVHTADFATLRDKNVPLFKTFLETIDTICPKLEHVVLQTGGKHYGVHLGPVRSPSVEDRPRYEDEYNFYFLQENDMLAMQQKKKTWHWSVIRPNGIIGYTPHGSGMSEVLSLAIYFLICQELNEPAHYFGNDFMWNTYDDKSSSKGIAKMSVWAATQECTKEEAFNYVNGDVFRWKHLWPELAAYFGAEAPEPEFPVVDAKSPAPKFLNNFDMIEWSKDKQPVWERIVAKLGGHIKVQSISENKHGNGIGRIPGPLLAAYSDWWRLWLVWRGRPEVAHIKLHEKYGPVVRLGPNMVSYSDPDAVKVIYALNAGYVKSGFYPVQQTITKEGNFLQGMFNTVDEKYHAKLRRSVANSYALSTLVQFEPLVDSTTTAFLEQLRKRYADKPAGEGVCDFAAWLQYYAFDVIGELTYSKRLGFVDRATDVDNIISSAESTLKYFAVIGQMPLMDKFFMKNPVRLWLSRIGVINASSPVVTFAQKRMKSRLSGAESQDTSQSELSKRDFLSRFIGAGEKDPEFMTPQRVLSLTVANVFAGSDTTAISLRAIFYNLLKNPEKLQKLQQELLEREHEGYFRDNTLVQWNEAHKLPYLTAVIKEALRIHPAVGLPLERVVPSVGAQLCGYFIPGGTIVGCSAWTIHQSEKIFGPDVHLFRPERWLEGSEQAQANMNSCLFTFGAGARTCAGKNISYLEMYKLVPAVLRTFDVELAHPERDWQTENIWFVKQTAFEVRLTTRAPKDS
ncbi:hypothetical protein IFR05_008812 [Cadophora sp. M221]|nr:hypothetical protein IFR05_008812 [Cadophora sp. M221]